VTGKEQTMDQSTQTSKSGRSMSWIAWLVGLSVALAIVGMALHAAQLSRRARRPPSRPTSDVDGVRSILPGEPEPTDTQAPERTEPAGHMSPWWPAMGRLGLGFFAGFCVAYTLKAFVKLTIILAGLAVIGLVALQQTGAITVDWSVVEGWLAQGSSLLAEQFDSIQAFVTGLIPTSTSAVAGAALGAIKK
jgi:uncharacterized membrane protein (Fun14 family)